MSKNTLETYVKEVRSGRLNECHSIQQKFRKAKFQVSPISSDRESLQTTEVYRDPRSGACLQRRRTPLRSVRAVEDDTVDSRRKQQNLKFPFGKFLVEDDSANREAGLPRKAITMDIDPEIAEKLEKLKGQGSWNELMQEFLELREEKLASEKPKSVKTDSRYIPAKIKKHSLKKTRGTCAFPGCTKPYKILHHTKRFALTNEHEADSLQPLCKAHEHLAHLGLIEHEEHNPESWKLRRFPDHNNPAYEIDMAVQRFKQMPKMSNH